MQLRCHNVPHGTRWTSPILLSNHFWESHIYLSLPVSYAAFQRQSIPEIAFINSRFSKPDQHLLTPINNYAREVAANNSGKNLVSAQSHAFVCKHYLLPFNDRANSTMFARSGT